MKRILLVRWGGLGDLLVALPSIRLLRLGLPNASLTLVGRAEYASLLLQAEVIDEVVGQDDGRVLSLFSDAATAEDDRGRWLDGFDLCVAWMSKGRRGVRESVYDQSGGEKGRHTIWFDARDKEPMGVFFFCQTLDIIGPDLICSPKYEECARLPLGSIADVRAISYPRRPDRSRPLAVIHPGSGGEKKRWPLGNFLELAKRLRERRVSGIFVTGEAESALDRRVGAATRSLDWAWLRSPSLASLARLLGDVDIYLGNDSGITHLAAACGARVLAFFRNDLVDIWRPSGDSHLMSANNVDEISLESAWNTAAELLCI